MDGEIEEVEPMGSDLRRTLTSRSCTRPAVNFMPSRQLQYRPVSRRNNSCFSVEDSTLRHRRLNSEHNVLAEEETDQTDSPERQADFIVREMEQHQQLMEDSPLSEELRREALRDLPQGLTMKRHIRAKLSASVSHRSKRRPISCYKRLKYQISFAWKRFTERLRDTLFSIELWYEAIRNIEGQFGSAVGSYFRMVRRLFILDLALAVLLVLWLALPQALHDATVTNATDDGASWATDWITGPVSRRNNSCFSVEDSTLRHRRLNSEHNVLAEEETDQTDSPERQADFIVREMEQHQQLMEDSPLSEELRREALRDLPQGLTMKRHIRAKLSASVSHRSKRRPISCYKRLKYQISFAWKRFTERLRDTLFSIELWYEAIRNIEGQFGSAVGSYFRMVRRLFILDLALAVLLVLWLALPQALHDATVTNATDDGASWATDWITGKGGLSNSLMFYGHYHDGNISTPGTYNMPFAYFFTVVTLYLVFFAVLCYKTLDSYRRHFIETAGDLSHVFAGKVFSGWDFGIVCSNAADLHHHSIYNEMKELLNEQNRNRIASTKIVRFMQYSANIAVTGLVLGCISCALWGLWSLVSWPSAAHWETVVSLAITAVLAICPLLFHAVVRLEFYSPRTKVYVTLARTWLLDMSVIVLLFVYWSRSDTQCWETRFGQETYRLVLLETIVSLVVLPAIEIFRALLFKMQPKTCGPEFNIAHNSLTLIYNQSLVWFGTAFSPLLAACVAAKLLLLFYVKRECVFRTCQPARKVWRAAQTQTVMYMLVTLSLFTTLFAIGSIFLQMPSKQCGPFRQYPTVVSVVTSGVLRMEDNPVLQRAAYWLLRPAVLALAGLLLGISVVYTRGRARAQAASVALLRRLLRLHAKDKDFLLNAIARVSNGEWLYSPKDPEEEGPQPDSHTIKYLREVRKPSNSNYHFDASRLSRSFNNRPTSSYTGRPASNDGDTDSSFSWQGSSNALNNAEP